GDSSVVVDDRCVTRLTVLELENDSVLHGDAHAPVCLQLPLELVKPVARRKAHVTDRRCRVELIEQFASVWPETRRKNASSCLRVVAYPDVLRSLIAEAGDHYRDGILTYVIT